MNRFAFMPFCPLEATSPLEVEMLTKVCYDHVIALTTVYMSQSALQLCSSSTLFCQDLKLPNVENNVAFLWVMKWEIYIERKQKEFKVEIKDLMQHMFGLTTLHM
ncbi:hypothetical protein XENOCAPTIV_016392 [Xenoophorus captivus]|uniref:Uncharacterized protein n=1 Tax=Xenoophorus captivus TaxID=1517983 RepID=A0ABV0RSX1_9TELE